MFSFYTRGMAFVDMAHLCKENIKEGTITYHRKKTGQKLVIGLESCMAEIIERYSSFTKDSDYVLPILHSDNPRNIQVQYYNALRYQNIQLKKNRKVVGYSSSASHDLCAAPRLGFHRSWKWCFTICNKWGHGTYFRKNNTYLFSFFESSGDGRS